MSTIYCYNTPGEYNPPNAFYTQVSIPYGINVAKFIGLDGCYFKKITDKSGCQYIWHDRNRRVVEVWGKENNLPVAVELIKIRLEKMIENSD